MTREHVTALTDLINPVDTDKARTAYRNGEFDNADKVKDLNKRYRWDMFYAVKGWSAFGDESYLDDHIDTALREIVPPL